MKMKKLIVIMLSALLCLGIVACGADGSQNDGISFDKAEVTLGMGDHTTITVKPDEGYEGGDQYSFESSDTSVVTVSLKSKLTPETATITAKGLGTATITATSDNGKTASVAVTVVAKAQLTAAKVTVMQTETAAFPIINAEGFMYSITDSTIATIDATTGAITGVKVGSTQANAVKGDKSLFITVNVVKYELPVTTKLMNVCLADSDVTFPLAELEGVTLASEDESIATVAANGAITLKKAGRTKLTATKDGVVTSVELGVLQAKDKTYTFADTADARFNLYGRNNYVATSGRTFYFTSSGFDVTFYGTELKGNFYSGKSNSFVPWLSVFVDDESMTEKSVTADNRILKIASTKEYTIVSGLTKGWHTVKLRKRTAFQRGSTQMDYFGIKNLTVGDSDGYIGYAPLKSDFRIDVYGDSISCGYSNLTDGGSMTSENTDGNMAYHSVLANTIGADINVMACSGWGAVYGYTEAAANDNDVWYKYYTKLNPKSSVEYGASGADMIIINLGTNDAGNIGKVTNFSEQFKNKYKEWISALRTANPDAPIICTYGLMGQNATVKNAITAAVDALNDDNVFTYFYTNNASGGHPLVETHRAGAEELLTFLNSRSLIPAEI